jgi:4-amino-4-deoxy-L-arabinose transferase-like glycosyltransferase
VKVRYTIATVLAIFAVAILLRGVWLNADPPVRRSVGIVWHDEGAWVHNARNRVLWGMWRTDAWNPVFVAPVFTALEYGAFSTLGVGTWQARVVPAASGILAVLGLMIGLYALAGTRAALIGGTLLATNYAFVMWNRAALMESTMTMWMVMAWMAWTLASREGTSALRVYLWGHTAGGLAIVAWFTKAAAAFFVAALAIEIAVMALVAWRSRTADRKLRLAQAAFGAESLIVAVIVAAVVFVIPHWTDYQFYNWQMSVTRKPEYSIRAFLDRASWIPVVQGLFSAMWIELVAASAGLLALVLRWTSIRPGERLLVLWILVGLAELVVHDSGNERRYVMFIPAIIALASLVLASPAAVFSAASRPSRRSLAIAGLLVLPIVYVVAGATVRPFLIEHVEAGRLYVPIRIAALAAVVLSGLLVWRWRTIWPALGSARMRAVGAGLVTIAVVWNVSLFAGWARHRTTYNHDAAVALGRLVPAGAPVLGKLANGMALESQIRPLFVGNGFGNFEDRLRRDDARYILTYDLPRIGYESSDGSGLIQGILEHYPRRRTIATFEVDETRAPDRAILVDKFPEDTPADARD